MAKRASAEYEIRSGMIQRCYNPKNRNFSSYGGRGITMCDQWRLSFQAFLADMGLRPTAQHTIDRIDNNGNYEPGNCRWATRAEQGRNKGPYRPLEASKKARCTSRFSGVSKQGNQWAVFFRHKYVGRCADEVDAATLYNFVAFQAHGNLATQNRPTDELSRITATI